MENHPPDWPCKLCNRRLDLHKPYSEGGRLWCFWLQDNPPEEQVDGVFTPIDNLTYVERLADVRKADV